MPPIYEFSGLCVCMHACIRKERILENEKLKDDGYRDGIKRKETRQGWHYKFGIAHYAMLHTIQVDDVIPILSP